MKTSIIPGILFSLLLFGLLALSPNQAYAQRKAESDKKSKPTQQAQPGQKEQQYTRQTPTKPVQSSQQQTREVQKPQQKDYTPAKKSSSEESSTQPAQRSSKDNSSDVVKVTRSKASTKVTPTKSTPSDSKSRGSGSYSRPTKQTPSTLKDRTDYHLAKPPSSSTYDDSEGSTGGSGGSYDTGSGTTGGLKGGRETGPSSSGFTFNTRNDHERLRRIPKTCKPVTHGGVHYYHNDGIYYRDYGSYYMMVRPPVGLHVTILPDGAILVYYDNYHYYYYYGGFYWYDPTYSYYIVVDPPSEVVYTDPSESEEYAVTEEELMDQLDKRTPGFDRLVLIDGSLVEGHYLGGTAEFLMMEIAGDTLNIPLAKVLTIELAPAAEDSTNMTYDESLEEDEFAQEQTEDTE